MNWKYYKYKIKKSVAQRTACPKRAWPAAVAVCATFRYWVRRKWKKYVLDWKWLLSILLDKCKNIWSLLIMFISADRKNIWEVLLKLLIKTKTDSVTALRNWLQWGKVLSSFWFFMNRLGCVLLKLVSPLSFDFISNFLMIEGSNVSETCWFSCCKQLQNSTPKFIGYVKDLRKKGFLDESKLDTGKLWHLCGDYGICVATCGICVATCGICVATCGICVATMASVWRLVASVWRLWHLCGDLWHLCGDLWLVWYAIHSVLVKQ